MAVKLTLPQWLLLVDLDENGKAPIKGNLRSGKKLVSLGFAEISEKYFVVTDAGRTRSREPNL